MGQALATALFASAAVFVLYRASQNNAKAPPSAPALSGPALSAPALSAPPACVRADIGGHLPAPKPEPLEPALQLSLRSAPSAPARARPRSTKADLGNAAEVAMASSHVSIGDDWVMDWDDWCDRGGNV